MTDLGTGAIARQARVLSRLRNRFPVGSLQWAVCSEELAPASGHTSKGGEFLRNTGWTDEARTASLAVRQAKAKLRQEERDRMFAEQQERGGRDFVDNWYPRGRDGVNEDPHYGQSTKAAPYGYVEGTMTPRKEPLYDRFGRPIIPRSWNDYHKPEKSGIWPFEKDTSLERDLYWLGKVERAERVWGRFGEKKRFMDEHPGATEGDWEKAEKKRSAEWKTRR